MQCQGWTCGPDELKAKQKADSTLSKYWELADKSVYGGKQQFITKKGILYRKYCGKQNADNLIQLVVPNEVHEKVVSQAHDTLLAGHRGAGPIVCEVVTDKCFVVADCKVIISDRYRCISVAVSAISLMFVATEDGTDCKSGNSDYSTEKKMKCNMCRRRFRTAVGLLMHKRQRHVTGNQQKASHGTVRKFKQGCQENDGNVENTMTASTDLSGGVFMSSEATQKEVFICSTCGRQFRLRQSLVAHMVTHTGERPFACRAPGCTKRFGQSSTRNFHERTHSDLRPFLCTQCGRSFKQSSYLKIHTEIVHSDEQRRYICPACDREFRTPKALNLHVWNRHTDERNQVCEQCSKQFKTRQQLLRHQKAVHLHERPFRCNVCTRTFSQPNNLKSHMRMHTGERPYLCSVCFQSFANSGSCRNHLLTHYSAVSVAAS